jgi:tetratricopeptide (TPR) repeat protein
LLAGEQALQADKPQEALEYFERARAAQEGDTPSAGASQRTDADTAALFFGLGRAQAAALPRHQLAEAVESLRRAFNDYRQAGDVNQAVAVAAYPFYPPVGHHQEVVQLIDHALELVREQPDAHPNSYREGRLLSRRGMVKGMVEGGDYPAAQEDFQQALAIAQRLGDTALELRTLAWAARVDRFHLNFDGCLQKSYRVVELARRVSEPLAELQARRLAANILTYQGDLTSAGFHSWAMLELAEWRDDHYWLITALTANERLARLQGRWQAAREFSDRGLARSPLDPRLLAPRALLEYELGNDGAGEAYLNSFVDAIRLVNPGTTSEYATPAILIPLIARLTSLPPTILNVAEERAEEILSSKSLTPIVASVARAGRGLLAVFRNDAVKDAGVARQQYDALTSDPTNVRGAILPTGVGVMGDSLLGLLAQAVGNPDQAIAHFEDALDFCRRTGCRSELAWTCYSYAEALWQRNAGGDQEQPRSLLNDALDISRELGMQTLRKRVEARRAS